MVDILKNYKDIFRLIEIDSSKVFVDYMDKKFHKLNFTRKKQEPRLSYKNLGLLNSEILAASE